MKSNLKRTGFIFACVAPAVILFTIFMLVPTFNVFRLSMYQRSTFNPNEVFIGMKNFQMLMKDANFIRSMQKMLLLFLTKLLLLTLVLVLKFLRKKMAISFSLKLVLIQFISILLGLINNMVKI